MFEPMLSMRAALPALVVFLAWGLAVPAAALQAKRDPTAAATDCVACHGGAKVLPTKHKALKGMKWSDCTKCHQPGDEDSSLAGKMPASHAHALAGQDCASCHGTEKPAAVPTAKCASCHDLDKLVARTSTVKPKNPHTSPHYGKELDCDNCHVQHGKSLNFCNDCHEFDFRVP